MATNLERSDQVYLIAKNEDASYAFYGNPASGAPSGHQTGRDIGIWLPQGMRKIAGLWYLKGASGWWSYNHFKSYRNLRALTLYQGAGDAYASPHVWATDQWGVNYYHRVAPII